MAHLYKQRAEAVARSLVVIGNGGKRPSWTFVTANIQPMRGPLISARVDVSLLNPVLLLNSSYLCLPLEIDKMIPNLVAG